MKKILYLGKIDKYISNLESKLKLNSRLFLTFLFDPKNNLKLSMEQILRVKPDLIIFDYDGNLPHLRKLMRSVKLNPDLVVQHFICLAPEQARKDIDKRANLGDMIYFIKTVEQEDVVYCIKSLLVPDEVKNQEAAKAFFHEKLELQQIIRICYVTKNHAKIESNRSWADGAMIKFTLPYLGSIFRTAKHKINAKSVSDSVTHFKYNYRLDYQYHTTPIKPDDRSRLLAEYRYKLQELPIGELVFDAVEEIDKKPKSLLLVSDKKENSVRPDDDSPAAAQRNLEICTKAYFFNWLYEQCKSQPYYRDTISIYDQNYSILTLGTAKLDQMNSTVLTQSLIIDPKTDIVRDKPSIVVVCCDEINNYDKIVEIISATTQVRDYFPYILLFNYVGLDVETLRHSLQYHFVIATKADINESVIFKLLDLYRSKKMEKELKKATKSFDSLKQRGLEIGQLNEKVFLDHKIYKSLDDIDSLISYSIPIEMIWMSEFEIVFHSEEKMEVGEIYSVQLPISIQILIVPHILNSKENNVENCYRGLIHYVDEIDKQALRRFVNHVSGIHTARSTALTQEEITEIKKQYFVKY
jgi:hypothetical protein